MSKYRGKNCLLGFKQLNVLILFLYIVLLCFISYNHEPWHNEGQAWLIARDDSLRQLLTITTHYEGHPPLWHICLMPFAKLGVPFLFGLKIMNIFFSAVAMGFLIFKSPLPWYLRFTLPFTYYFFYQYGVINRSYSLLMLGAMLTAYYYSKRQIHPYKLAFSLAILAGSQAYGMMFACGVAITWLIGLCRGEHINYKNIASFFHKSQEAKALSLLFFISLGFGLTIIPFKDTAFTSRGLKDGFVENIFYLFTVLPGQLLSSNSMESSTMNNSIKFFLVNLNEFINLIPSQGFYMVLIALNWVVVYTYGVLFNLALFYISMKTKKLLLFLCPLILMNILGSVVYWNTYHSGIWGCLYVFILWQIWSSDENINLIQDSIKQKFTYHWEFSLAKYGLICCCIAILFINFSWSWEASKKNILYNTDTSGNISAFIKDNNLMDYKIWVATEYEPNKKMLSDNVVTGSLAVNCYFPHNIIQNLDGGNTKYAYHEYKLLPKEKYVEQVKKFGQPDFIIGEEIHLNYVFSQPAKYVLIKKFPAAIIWKTSIQYASTKMYIREDLLKDFPQFHEIEVRDNK